MYEGKTSALAFFFFFSCIDPSYFNIFLGKRFQCYEDHQKQMLVKFNSRIFKQLKFKNLYGQSLKDFSSEKTIDRWYFESKTQYTMAQLCIEPPGVRKILAHLFNHKRKTRKKILCVNMGQDFQKDSHEGHSTHTPRSHMQTIRFIQQKQKTST